MALREKIRSWSVGRAAAASARPADTLDAFVPESGPPAVALRIVLPSTDAAKAAAPSRRSRLRLIVAGLGLIVVAAAAAGGYWWMNVRALRAVSPDSAVTIESDPPGAQVFAGAELRGTTPLTLRVAAGEHLFDVVRDGRRRTVRVVASPPAALVHHVQFDAPAVVPIAPATLDVATDPPKQRVLIDGEFRGDSPLTVSGLTPGPHRVQVVGTGGAIERRVELEAGRASSILISAGAGAPVQTAGWVAIAAPVPLQVSEGGVLLGSSDLPRIMLASGRHDLTLSNQALGFSERREVRIVAGAQLAVRVELPKAPLSINALPWAEVWIDGTRIGETPIANHQVLLGSHEVVFRHPEFGERRQSVTVTLGAPARVSVDMKRPVP